MNRTTRPLWRTIDYAVLNAMMSPQLVLGQVVPLVQERVLHAFDRTLLTTNPIVHPYLLDSSVARDIMAKRRTECTEQEDRDERH